MFSCLLLQSAVQVSIQKRFDGSNAASSILTLEE
jgi:hypothetical protein